MKAYTLSAAPQSMRRLAIRLSARGHLGVEGPTWQRLHNSPVLISRNTGSSLPVAVTNSAIIHELRTSMHDAYYSESHISHSLRKIRNDLRMTNFADSFKLLGDAWDHLTKLDLSPTNPEFNTNDLIMYDDLLFFLALSVDDMRVFQESNPQAFYELARVACGYYKDKAPWGAPAAWSLIAEEKGIQVLPQQYDEESGSTSY